MKFNITKLTFFVLTVGILISHPAGAMIVYDPTNNAQLVSQLNQMVKQYQQQLQQLQQAVQQTSAMTGTRNMGSLINSPADAQLRRYLPSDWQSTLGMGSASGLTGSASQTQSLYNGYNSTYAPVSGASAITRDPNGPMAQAIDRKTQTTYASMAASEQSFNNTTPRTSNYESLLQQLNTTTDLKSSVDLQSRINAENGMALNELVRLNSIQIQQKAAEDNQSLTTARQAATANRFDQSQAQNAYHP